MATDLNLHRRTAVTSPDTAEGRARDREVHNRERTWIFCFCLDRSFSAQMGKPYTIKEEYVACLVVDGAILTRRLCSFIIRNASQWCRSPVAIPSDVALAAYAVCSVLKLTAHTADGGRFQDLQRILTRSLDLLYSGTNSPSGLQLDSDYLLVITTMETQILAWQHEWVNGTNTSSESIWLIFPKGISRGRLDADEPEHIASYRIFVARFYFNYAMLIVNSFGLQNALERSAVDIGHFFARCYSSAVACATVMRDEMGPSGNLRYAPDSNYVQGSYAVLSLLKVRFFALVGGIYAHVFFPCQATPSRVQSLPRPRAQNNLVGQ